MTGGVALIHDTGVDVDPDFLAGLASEALARGASFADIRVEATRIYGIVLRDGVGETSAGSDVGAAIRVFYHGFMGFASTSRLSRDAIRAAFEKAFSMARAASLSGAEPLVDPVTLKPLEAAIVWPQQRRLEDVGFEEKLRDLREADKVLASKPFVKSRSLRYAERMEYRLYVSSEPRVVEEKRQLALVVGNAYGSEAGVVGSAHDSLGTIKGYTLWDKEEPAGFALRILERLEKQLKAKTPRAGVFPVVLGPEAVGVFVHEAFGHLAEADLVAGGSVLQGKRGEVVASPLVSIVDDPGIDDGFGTYAYDDEGVRASRAVIVEKGVHRQIMTDRVYARLLEAEPTGNARAESYRVKPLVRMRNTVMLPGDASVEELFEGIEYGYYIVSTMGGQTNIDGSFQVGVEEAYEIVNGRVGEPVRNLGIAGNTLDTLKNIDMVAKDFQIFYGMCGKGQAVYVSDGGPHVRVKAMTVGGRTL